MRPAPGARGGGTPAGGSRDGKGRKRGAPDQKRASPDAAAGTFGHFRDDEGSALRVATKYPNVARDFYAARGRDIDVIRLNGSIEIAPRVGLSDVIVDIVETGATLRENDLEVVETIFPISARLIANKAGYKFKRDRIQKLVGSLARRSEVKP